MKDIKKIVDKCSGITDDSAKIKSNFLFFAIKGERFDGHDYISDALNMGALYAVGENDEGLSNEKKNKFIKVDDSRKALAIAAKHYYGNPSKNLKMIGVTGTNGKTTISTLIYEILKKSGKKAALIGTNGIYIYDTFNPSSHTTPGVVELNIILNKIIEAGCEYCVMEVSSHALHQKRVFGIEYDSAIFSNLTQDHLDYHKSMEEYAKSKKILFDNLDENSFSIVNLDDMYSVYMVQDTKAKKIGISFNDLDNIDFDIIKIGSDSKNIYYNDEIYLNNLIGKFNEYNLAQAIAACKTLGLNNGEIYAAMQHLTSPEGRMQKVNLRNGAIGVVDYAHTPDALENVLTTLKDSGINNKIITVFGCGGDRDKSKRPKMGAVVLKHSDLSIVTSDNPRTEDPKAIINDIIVDNPNKFVNIIERREAIEFAYENSNEGDFVLIAGKGHEKYQIIGNEKLYFSDLDELKKFT